MRQPVISEEAQRAREICLERAEALLGCSCTTAPELPLSRHFPAAQPSYGRVASSRHFSSRVILPNFRGPTLGPLLWLSPH